MHRRSLMDVASLPMAHWVGGTETDFPPTSPDCSQQAPICMPLVMRSSLRPTPPPRPSILLHLQTPVALGAVLAVRGSDALGAGFEGQVPAPPHSDGSITAWACRSCLRDLSVVRMKGVRGSGQGDRCPFPVHREETEKSTTRGTGSGLETLISERKNL